MATFEAWSSRKRSFCSRVCYWMWMRGQPTAIEDTPEIREQRRQRMMGPKNPMWQDGDSDRERRNSAYKSWRLAVFNRDGFICRGCGYFNGCGEKRRDLHAHHVVPWIKSKLLRYDVENGITLCVPCHRQAHPERLRRDKH